MKRFTYANVAATTALVVAIGLTPAGAHVTDSISHLWDDHIEPKISTPGKINAKANPVHWTKLKGVPMGLADGKDAAAPKNVVRYDRIKVVSGNGTPTQNGAKLVAALNAANGATVDKPRLIYLEPGTFELSDTLTMRQYVDIAGSGRRASRIYMDESSTAGSVIDMTSNTTLRDLRVHRTEAPAHGPNDPMPIAVKAPFGHSSMRLERVNVEIDATVPQGQDPIGVQGVRSEADTLLEDVEVIATTDDGDAIAVYSGGALDISNSSMNAQGAFEAYGVNAVWASDNATVTVSDSLLTAFGGGPIAARASHTGALYVKDSFINGGIWGAGNQGSGPLDIRHSKVYGGSNAVATNGGPVRVAFSELENGTFGAVICASNVNQGLVYFETNCPT